MVPSSRTNSFQTRGHENCTIARSSQSSVERAHSFCGIDASSFAQAIVSENMPVGFAVIMAAARLQSQIGDG
jgi:hypothetical protein